MMSNIALHKVEAKLRNYTLAPPIPRITSRLLLTRLFLILLRDFRTCEVRQWVAPDVMAEP